MSLQSGALACTMLPAAAPDDEGQAARMCEAAGWLADLASEGGGRDRDRRARHVRSSRAIAALSARASFWGVVACPSWPSSSAPFTCVRACACMIMHCRTAGAPA